MPFCCCPSSNRIHPVEPNVVANRPVLPNLQLVDALGRNALTPEELFEQVRSPRVSEAVLLPQKNLGMSRRSSADSVSSSFGPLQPLYRTRAIGTSALAKFEILKEKYLKFVQTLEQQIKHATAENGELEIKKNQLHARLLEIRTSTEKAMAPERLLLEMRNMEARIERIKLYQKYNLNALSDNDKEILENLVSIDMAASGLGNLSEIIIGLGKAYHMLLLFHNLPNQPDVLRVKQFYSEAVSRFPFIETFKARAIINIST